MNSITYFCINELKKRIKSKISSISDEMVETIIKSISHPSEYNKYITLMSEVEEKVRKLVVNIIKETFEELDYDYSISRERKCKYVINKSHVKRTIVTIFGDVTFERTYFESRLDGSKYFFIDTAFGIPKYNHYDPIVKGLAINRIYTTNQAEAGREIGERISTLKDIANNEIITSIPRQSVHNWNKNWMAPDAVYEQQEETPKTLFIEADEKFIGCQDLKNDIMVKCMVAFEDVKKIGKNRNELINRTTVSTYGSNPWNKFLNVLGQKYDFDKIEDIKLMGDGANWINSGIDELKVCPNAKLTRLLCKFHFKQAIHHITTDEEKRKILLDTFNTKSKKEFKNKVLEITKDITESKRRETINKKLNYILNNYKAIKDMLDSPIGSSMESHISHFIASIFSSRPKGYSSLYINKYLKLNDYRINGINLFNLYLKSYANKEVITLGQDEINESIFENKKGLPVLNSGEKTGLFNKIHSIVYPNK